MNYDVPTLGVCLGYEIIAVAYQAGLKNGKRPTLCSLIHMEIPDNGSATKDKAQVENV